MVRSPSSSSGMRTLIAGIVASIGLAAVLWGCARVTGGTNEAAGGRDTGSEGASGDTGDGRHDASGSDDAATSPRDAHDPSDAHGARPAEDARRADDARPADDAYADGRPGDGTGGADAASDGTDIPSVDVDLPDTRPPPPVVETCVRSGTAGEHWVNTHNDSVARVVVGVSGVPEPSRITAATLHYDGHDMDHPGAEGWLRVNDGARIALPADVAFDNRTQAFSVDVGGMLVAGENRLAFLAVDAPDVSYYSVSNIRIEATGTDLDCGSVPPPPPPPPVTGQPTASGLASVDDCHPSVHADCTAFCTVVVDGIEAGRYIGDTNGADYDYPSYRFNRRGDAYCGGTGGTCVVQVACRNERNSGTFTFTNPGAPAHGEAEPGSPYRWAHPEWPGGGLLWKSAANDGNLAILLGTRFQRDS